MLLFFPKKREKKSYFNLYLLPSNWRMFWRFKMRRIIKSYSLKNKASLYHFCLRTEVIWDSLFIKTQKLMVLGWNIHKRALILSVAYYWHQWRRLLRVGLASQSYRCSLGNTADEKELARAMRPISQPINSWKETYKSFHLIRSSPVK